MANCDLENYDWRQTMLEQGFFVLASRCRNSQDEQLIVDILEKELKRTLNIPELFSPSSKYMPKNLTPLVDQIVWTSTMCRMTILCAEAWRHNEAALMIGDSGCGKTTAAHILVIYL